MHYFQLILAAKLKDELDKASEEDVEAFKERYGKEFVETLIRETASYSWIDSNCEPCPSCQTKITVSGI